MKTRKIGKNKDLHNILLAVAVLMIFIFIVSSAIYFIKENYGLSCSCKFSLPIVIAALTSLGVFVGILVYYFLSKSFSKEKEKLFGNVEKTLNFLDQEEKSILISIIENNGEISQTAISSKTGIDAVKIYRRLSSLESKGIVRKLKKGMTNRIILTDDFKKIFVKTD